LNSGFAKQKDLEKASFFYSHVSIFNGAHDFQLVRFFG